MVRRRVAHEVCPVRPDDEDNRRAMKKIYITHVSIREDVRDPYEYHRQYIREDKSEDDRHGRIDRMRSDELHITHEDDEYRDSE